MHIAQVAEYIRLLMFDVLHCIARDLIAASDAYKGEYNINHLTQQRIS